MSLERLAENSSTMSTSAENFTTRPDPNIDGGWGWVVVFITFMIRIIIDGYIYSFGIFYAELLEYYNTTGGSASLVMSLLIGVTHLAGPIASGLINKLGCRAASFLGTALTTLGMLLSLAAPRIEYLYITIGLISGIGCGLAYLPTVVAVALHFEKKRAFAMGVSMSGSGVALVVCAPLLEWLIEYYHYWKGALLIFAGIVMNCFVLSFFYKTFTPPVNRPAPIDEPSTSEVTARKSTSKTLKSEQPQTLSQSSQTHKKGEEIQGLYTISSSNVQSGTSTSAHLSGLMQKSDILYTGSSSSLHKLSQLETTPPMITRTHSTEIQRRGVCAVFKDIVVQMVGTSLLKDYAFLIFSFGSFLQYFGLITPTAYMYHKAIEMNIATSVEASLLLSLIGVGSTIGKIAIGYWADRTSVSVLNIYAVCLLISGISTMMTSLITNYFLMVLYIFVYGISWGGSIGLSSILMVNLFGMQNLSNAYGLFLLFVGVATTAGTPITGVLHDVTSSYDAGFYLSGGVITLGSLLLFSIPPTACEIGSMSSALSFTTNPDPNIDGGWGWVIVFITFAIHFIFDGFMYTFGIFYAEFLADFQSTGGATSLVMAILIGTCYTAGPIASGLINKYDCRVVSLIGTGIACVGLLLSLAVPTVEFLYITTGLIAGIGFGLAYLPTIVSVALYFERKRATAMGISMAGSGIGSLAFAPLMETLIKHYHYWKGALLIAVGLLLQCFVLSFFYHVMPPFDRKERTGESASSESASRGIQTGEDEEPVQGTLATAPSVDKASTPGAMQKPDILYSSSSKSLLLQIDPSVSVTHTTCLGFTDTISQMIGLTLFKNYVFLTFAFCTFLHYLGINTPCVYLYHKSIELGIATTSEASIILSIMGVANTIGKVAIGFWADKTSIKVLTLYNVCLLLNGISMMMTSLIADYYLMALYSFVFGATWGASLGLSSIVLVKLLGMHRLNNAYGLFLLFTGIGTFTGVPMTGALHDITKNYDAGFYLSGGLITIGTLILFLIPTIQRKFPQ